MNNDRELLELAAKAAGFNLPCWSEKITDYDSPHYGSSALHEEGSGGQCRSWNPLTDDGDALRLAVKLEMCLDLAQEGDGLFNTVDLIAKAIHHDKSDPYAATRRTIVMCAAEIGKTM